MIVSRARILTTWMNGNFETNEFTSNSGKFLHYKGLFGSRMSCETLMKINVPESYVIT